MAVDPVSLAINAALLAANMAMTASQEFDGPRLDSLEVTTAAFGTPLDVFYGDRWLTGRPVIWKEDLREEKVQNKTKGGKYNEYKYYGTWAVMIADVEIDKVLQIKFDKHLIYDASGAGPLTPLNLGGPITDYLRIYLGTEDQEPDPRIEATTDAALGAGSTSAYRGVAYIVFEDVPLEKFGNRIPQVDVRAVRAAAASLPIETYAPELTKPFRMWGLGFTSDWSRIIWGTLDDYEIWDVAARAPMITGEFQDGVIDVYPATGVGATGRLYLLETATRLVSYGAEGTGAPTLEAELTGDGDFAQVLRVGGFDYVCVVPVPLIEVVQLVVPGYDMVILDTHDVGSGFSATQYVLDGHGDVWAIGAPHVGVGSGDTLHMWRVVNTSLRAVPDYHTISGLSTYSGAPDAYGVHCARHGHFVVGWNGDTLLAIDDETFTVTTSRAFVTDPYSGPKQFIWAPANPASLWLSDGVDNEIAEISTQDLTTLRSVTLGDWGGDYPDGAIYDPLNHAIITAAAVDNKVEWRFLDRFTGEGTTLRAIVEDVAERAGLDPADIDATDLTQTVRGYSWSQGSGKQILEPLLEFFDSEARPHDFELQFIRRGDAPGGTIATELMGAGGGERHRTERTLDGDLPLRAWLTFADPDQDQQTNTVPAQRIAGAVDSRREISLDLTTLVLTPDEGREGVDGWLRRTWYEAETYELSLTRGFSNLEPGDLQTLTLDDIARSAKLDKLEFGANGVLTTRWKRDTPRVHEASGQAGAPADGYTPPVMLVPGYSKGFVLDTALVADADDGLIAYLAAAPYSSGWAWPGATFYTSADGVSFGVFDGVGADHQATWGVTTDALGAALPEVWDRAGSVNVRLRAGALTSTSEANVLAGANMALVGDELIGFSTATLEGDGSYTLSGLVRGRRGTEQHVDAHAAGDRFVLMSAARVRHVMGASDVGDLIYYKASTATALNGAGFVDSLTYSGASLKPYSPAHLKVTASGGDLVATWVRRTRLGGFNVYGMSPPLGEGAEAYVGQILDAGGGVVRTFAGLTTPTFTYTAAQQATDGGAGVTARAMQVSSIVGNGFPADAPLAA